MADKYRSEILISLALIGLTFVAFSRVCSCDFVNYDDDFFVTGNPQVKAGLTGEGIRWGWSTRAGFWHPLTWWSLQLDAAVYGLNPAGFHRTNLWLHTANAILVFWFLRRVTGAVWRSAAVATLFALHPLHVESVAWIAERKGLLSTFFGLLALGAYGTYAQRPGLARYLLVLAAFICSLLAKTMLVTLPGIFLLLDYWPLRRFRMRTEKQGSRMASVSPFARLFLEKVPFLIIAAVMVAVTIQAEKQVGALVDQNDGESLVRISAGLVAYIKYLGQTFWPSSLTVFYPRHADGYSGPAISGAVILLVILTVVAIRFRRRFPYGLVGWLWFVGTLLPVIGLWRLGWHERADRYTYVPHIGLFVALVWGSYDLAIRSASTISEIRNPKSQPYQFGLRISTFDFRISDLGFSPIALTLFTCILLACLVTTWKQIDHWRTSESLWQHNLAVEPGSWVGHNNLGTALQDSGKLTEAESHFLAALQRFPNYWSAHHNLGNTYKALGRLAEAEDHYRQAARIDPGREVTYQELGALLWYQGKRPEAIDCFTQALQINPDAPNAHNMLGLDLLLRRKPAEAELHFRHALNFLPAEAELHANLGAALFNQGFLAEGVEQLSLAVQLKPTYASGHQKLALALQRQGQFEKAAYHFSEALRLDPKLASGGK
jgi:tetratricopeptide (TPR) repeat protein